MSYKSEVRTDARTRMKIRCVRHGKIAWRGDVVCERCKRVYLRADDNVYAAAPASGDCDCGVRLFPRHETDTGKIIDGSYFSARAICQHCANRGVS